MTLLFFMQVNSVSAFNFDSDFILKRDTKKVAVLISDSATGGCWTNLIESKKYAEDKLTLSGVNVVDEKIVPFATEKSYTFQIFVQALRWNNFCFGQIRISMLTYTYIDERFHQALIYDGAYTATAMPTNLNNDVLEVLGRAFKTLK